MDEASWVYPGDIAHRDLVQVDETETFRTTTLFARRLIFESPPPGTRPRNLPADCVPRGLRLDAYCIAHDRNESGPLKRRCPACGHARELRRMGQPCRGCAEFYGPA